MLSINDKMPEFKKLSNIDLNTSINNAFPEVSYSVENGISKLIIKDEEKTILNSKGKWLVIFAYPKDFTFICPTEIVAFGELKEDFNMLDTNILAFSTDSEFVHRAWRNDHSGIKNVPIPLIADTNGSLSKDLGIYNEQEGIAERATFIVDPMGVIQHVSIYAGSVGRNPDEIFRILSALQSDELCPCNWKSGDDTIKPE